MYYNLGLDIGTTSIGWAAVRLNQGDEPDRIIDLGSRIFDIAENPKDGSSLAKPRRDARSMRRRLRRRAHRKERIKRMLVRREILTEEDFRCLFSDAYKADIYELRVNALDRPLTNKEFTRILIHIANRRGFKSNRKADASDKEAGKLLKATSENRKLMEDNKYRTVGEMLLKDPKFKDTKRNKRDDYSHTVERVLLEEELKEIFAAQKSFGNSFASDEVMDEYLNIFNAQRSFAEGPGGNSPYGGDQVEKMIGYCTLEPNEKRAVKSSFTFEYFNLLQKINTITIQNYSEKRFLTQQERILVREAAFNTETFTYKSIRKVLGEAMSGDERFGNLTYRYTEDKDITEGKAKFQYLPAYHRIRKSIDKLSKGLYESFPIELKDDIGYALNVYKQDDKIKSYLSKYDLQPEVLDAICSTPGFSKTAHLSLKVCKKLIPFLEQGETYDKACALAGYDFSGGWTGGKNKYLHFDPSEFDDITSSAVKRAISQSFKVINAIIRRYGSPSYIYIELAREMGKTKEERNELIKKIETNTKLNEEAFEEIRKNFHIQNPKPFDLVKYKLWKEQDGCCLYSLKKIPIEELFGTKLDVDHIIPYSLSFDDSYNNKVLVYADENRQKGNRLPLEYLTGQQRDDFIVYVKNNVKNGKKAERLLKEKVSEENSREMKARSLVDTMHATVFIKDYLRNRLLLAETPLTAEKKNKKRIYTVNGIITSKVRTMWGINKVRADGDLHHAADAVVIACVTDGMTQKITEYSKKKESAGVSVPKYIDGKKFYLNKATGELTEATGKEIEEKQLFPEPWKMFRHELEARLSPDPTARIADLKLTSYETDEEPKPVFVSRMPKRKATGAAHKETIFSAKAADKGILYKKTSIKDLKLDKSGEIDSYYNPQEDLNVYNELKDKLHTAGGNANKAFENKVYKRKKDGTPANEIKTVKVYINRTCNVRVNNGKGAAENDSMVRIDVFKSEGDGYYFVPIYVADTLKPDLPNKAVVANTKEWKEMLPSDFLFSVYPNDLLHIIHKKGLEMSLVNPKSTLPQTKSVTDTLVYFTGASISSGAIGVINHDNTYRIQSVGFKTLALVEKYQVDVLGNTSVCGKEKRNGFGKENGEA